MQNLTKTLFQNGIPPRRKLPSAGAFSYYIFMGFLWQKSKILELADRGAKIPLANVISRSEADAYIEEVSAQLAAADDFLSTRFLCEYGQVTLSSQESLRELFDLMRVEQIASSDGRALHSTIQEE